MTFWLTNRLLKQLASKAAGEKQQIGRASCRERVCLAV